ncbi:MAG: signal recognition particle receptor subunit alpha, partial [Lachnospiraceae bacterium]|nr:signal recognition particle receptor subunit alpha [Lachnospiraceae bacterium]
MEDKELDETLDGSLPEKKEKKGFFKRLVEGLTKTRNSISSGLEYVFNGFTELDDDFYEELEEVLIMADIGVKTTDEIIEHLKESAKENKIKHPNECREFLFNYLKEKLKTPYDAYQYEDKTSVLLLIGVNGVGKTTTCGKLAGNLKANGKKVLLAAADTFRAA